MKDFSCRGRLLAINRRSAARGGAARASRRPAGRSGRARTPPPRRAGTPSRTAMQASAVPVRPRPPAQATSTRSHDDRDHASPSSSRACDGAARQPEVGPADPARLPRDLGGRRPSRYTANDGSAPAGRVGPARVRGRACRTGGPSRPGRRHPRYRSRRHRTGGRVRPACACARARACGTGIAGGGGRRTADGGPSRTEALPNAANPLRATDRRRGFARGCSGGGPDRDRR